MVCWVFLKKWGLLYFMHAILPTLGHQLVAWGINNVMFNQSFKLTKGSLIRLGKESPHTQRSVLFPHYSCALERCILSLSVSSLTALSMEKYQLVYLYSRWNKRSKKVSKKVWPAGPGGKNLFLWDLKDKLSNFIKIANTRPGLNKSSSANI